ncbi:hypothetical protein LSCM1_04250 [Leishmania martiniquensis]|uniref:Uncharacterized protein n=1 Tax=Leishmania martiniquensis TaxID=1580590 RepID=A0A836GK38_9TRYP|nr:hypothetical protein LSCM1_04250 [Leishmania martiniquensis]
MSHPSEGNGDVPTSMETPLSASLLSRGAGSFASHHPTTAAEALRPMSSSLSDGTAAPQQSLLVEEANMCSTFAHPPPLGTGAQSNLRATKTRLRIAQEAELGVLVRLRLLTEALMGVMSVCNSAGVAGRALTVARGGGDATEVVAPPAEGAMRAVLPAVIACPSGTGREEAMHLQAEMQIMMRCVTIPRAGLSAAAREQYSALRETLERHLCRRWDGVIGSTGGITGSNSCNLTSGTTQDLPSTGYYGAISSAFGSQTTEAIESGGVGAPTPHRIAKEGSDPSTDPAARHFGAVQVRRGACFFCDRCYCPPSPPRRSVSPCKQHVTEACGEAEVSTASAGTGSCSTSWGTGVPDSSTTPSHVCGLADRLMGETNGASRTAVRLPLPTRTPLTVKVSSAAWETMEERDVIKEGAKSGYSEEETGEATPAPSAPTASTRSAATTTSRPSPGVAKAEPCSPLSPCVLPRARHGAATVKTRESNDHADRGEELPEDIFLPPTTVKSLLDRLSQPLSATPSSSVGDVDEEGTYFPTPPPVKAHRRCEDECEQAGRHPAAGDSGNASGGADGNSAAPTMLNPTAPATTPHPGLLFGGDRDEGGDEPTRARQWETRMETATSPLAPIASGGQEGALQAVSVTHVSRPPPAPSLPPPKPAHTLTATDILATITALPPPSSSSLLSKCTRRAGKQTRAMRKMSAALAEAQRPLCDARKRLREVGDEEVRVDVCDRALVAVPLAGLPSLGADVAWSASAELGRGVCEEIDNDRPCGSAAALRTESESGQCTTHQEERAPRGCVRTREQRNRDAARAERVFGAVRGAYRLLTPASLGTSPRRRRATTEPDEALSPPSPSLSQSTPRQFWDISFS